MNWQFENYLTEKLTLIKRTENIDCDIVIANEQAFAEMETLTPNTIYVIIKMLAADYLLSAKQQPIQLLIMSEQNDLSKAQKLFNIYVEENNFKIITNGTEYVKQQYSNPVVLNNFEDVTYGVRSVLYVTGTLFLMDHIADITNVIINGVSVKPLSNSLVYTMTGNTQQVNGELIASTYKNIATISLTMTISSLDTYEVTENNITYNLLDELLKIMNGTESGGNRFTITFSIGSVTFSYSMVVTNITFTSSLDNIPSLAIGFMR